MLNDADCSIDHHLFMMVRRKGAAIAADPAGTIRFERECPR